MRGTLLVSTRRSSECFFLQTSALFSTSLVVSTSFLFHFRMFLSTSKENVLARFLPEKGLSECLVEYAQSFLHRSDGYLLTKFCQKGKMIGQQKSFLSLKINLVTLEGVVTGVPIERMVNLNNSGRI